MMLEDKILIDILNKKEVRCNHCDSIVKFENDLYHTDCPNCGMYNEWKHMHITYNAGGMHNLQDMLNNLLYEYDNGLITEEELLIEIDENYRDLDKTLLSEINYNLVTKYTDIEIKGVFDNIIVSNKESKTIFEKRNESDNFIHISYAKDNFIHGSFILNKNSLELLDLCIIDELMNLSETSRNIWNIAYGYTFENDKIYKATYKVLEKELKEELIRFQDYIESMIGSGVYLDETEYKKDVVDKDILKLIDMLETCGYKKEKATNLAVDYYHFVYDYIFEGDEKYLNY